MTDHSITLWRYDWLQTGRSAGTINEYQRQLRHFAAWLNRPLESACHADCSAYIMGRLQISPTSALLTWKALRSYYTFVESLDDTANPMAKVRAPRVAEPATHGVSAEDVKRLLAACVGNDFEAVRDRAIVLIFACTGLRRSELARLAVDDVSVEQRLLLVRSSKTGRPRVVPVSTEATMALVKYLRVRNRRLGAHEECLWLGTKGPLGISGLRLMLVRRSAQAGVRISAHQFRRAFAVNWLTAGGSQVGLMAICGWSSPAMPARYTRHASERVAADEYRRMFT